MMNILGKLEGIGIQEEIKGNICRGYSCSRQSIEACYSFRGRGEDVLTKVAGKMFIRSTHGCHFKRKEIFRAT